MAERYRDAYPLNTRWERPSDIPIVREPPDDLLWDEVAAPEVTDEEAMAMWAAWTKDDAERRGEVLVHEDCMWCGEPSRRKHPAGVVRAKWYCHECGRFQREVRE